MSSVTRALAVAFALTLAACSSVPEQMRVDTGADPANVNRDVRFRTTYYFRVFDYCGARDGDGLGAPVSDSLYRFVMTGKANMFANRVKFESGTLRAEQIDPFNASVEVDEETGRIVAIPADVVQARARRSAIMEEIKGLVSLKRELIALNAPVLDEDGNTIQGSSALTAGAAETALAQVDRQIEALAQQGLSEGGLPTHDSRGEANSIADSKRDTREGAPSDPVSVSLCPPGVALQRGFQVMGPQGVKSFDQQERLIMAMTTSADPLISVLERTSERVLREKASTLSDADLLLPLMRERLIASQMQLTVKVSPDDDQTEALLDELIAYLRSDPADISGTGKAPS